MMVDIKNLAYVPDSVEIPVGGTVTWTNSDTVPHTATAKEREALQSGTLNPGDSYSQTFDQPGTFDYFCEFHANMKGTIIVK
jgi:plastocyanin